MVRNIRHLPDNWTYTQRFTPRTIERPSMQQPWQEQPAEFDFEARWWPADRFDWPTEHPQATDRQENQQNK